MSPSDLTKEEQDHVRRALVFLRARSGGSWAPVAKLLRFKPGHLVHVAGGRDPVSASMAIRIARIAHVGIDALLAGEYPAEGTCPYCGHCPERKSRAH